MRGHLLSHMMQGAEFSLNFREGPLHSVWAEAGSAWGRAATTLGMEGRSKEAVLTAIRCPVHTGADFRAALIVRPFLTCCTHGLTSH